MRDQVLALRSSARTSPAVHMPQSGASPTAAAGRAAAGSAGGGIKASNTAAKKQATTKVAPKETQQELKALRGILQSMGLASSGTVLEMKARLKEAKGGFHTVSSTS